MESKNNITNIYEEANELKKTINVSTENLMINLSNIFNATKIDKNIKSENVDLNESMDSMANEINTLLNIVNKLKIKEFKNYEQNNKEDFEMFLQRKAMENKKIAKKTLSSTKMVYFANATIHIPKTKVNNKIILGLN